MAKIVQYSPQGLFDKALFNFDLSGSPYSNFKLSGLVTISVSDSFSYADYSSGRTDNFYSWTSRPETQWTGVQISDIEAVAAIYSNFAGIQFSKVVDYDSTPNSSIATPRDVGTLSNINISLVYRTDISNVLGQSGGGWDGAIYNYQGDAGDIVLNIANSILFNDYSFSSTSKLAQVLMHEMGHSIGLSHPHSSFLPNGSAVLTPEFSALQRVGFEKLGFQINSAADLNKEYFTIMSYDDQNTSVAYLNAYTPMILDVLALQQAYGEGVGTHGFGNDIITAGTIGYRTYFDTGGIDGIDLSEYTNGAYLNMGVAIADASHLVGLLVNNDDASKLFSGGNPKSLRWFYGEFENALGSVGTDHIIGNQLNNKIYASSGNDILDGGAGLDTAIYAAKLSEFSGTIGTQTILIDNIFNRYGRETLTNIERLSFTDTMLALDTGANQTAGSAYMLYQAAFNRTPDLIGLGYWIAQLDGGKDLVNDVANFFISSTEFTSKYGPQSSNADFVNSLYRNVLHRDGETSGVNFWNAQLDKSALSRSEILVDFATLPEGASLVASDITQGIAYTQWVG